MSCKCARQVGRHGIEPGLCVLAVGMVAGLLDVEADGPGNSGGQPIGAGEERFVEYTDDHADRQRELGEPRLDRFLADHGEAELAIGDRVQRAEAVAVVGPVAIRPAQGGAVGGAGRLGTPRDLFDPRLQECHSSSPRDLAALLEHLDAEPVGRERSSSLQQEGVEPLGGRQREAERDHATEGVAEQVTSRDAESVEKRAEIVDQSLERKGQGIAGMSRIAVAPQIGGEKPEAGMPFANQRQERQEIVAQETCNQYAFEPLPGASVGCPPTAGRRGAKTPCELDAAWCCPC